MKKIAIAGLALVAIIIGGVYLAQHGGKASEQNPASATTTLPSATSTNVAPGSHAIAVPDSGSVTLALGETASFHGFLITPTQVVQDSRCPAGVYCIQAGTVEVSLTARTPLGTFTRTAKLGDSVAYGSEKLTFSEVAPLKTAKPIDPSAYRFVVTIEQI